ncbi:MAG TPA: right-handed parallel beta-helix repeat-containing protein [Planctomycetota bacterium]
MLTQPERARGTWTGLAILALGIAIGALARPGRWLERTSEPREQAPFPALVPAARSESAPDNGLRTLELVIPAESAAILQRVRAAALERGILTQTEADTVPAEVRFDGGTHAAMIRLKGDWIDHVEGERWSYRIRLDATSFLGMREFSIQAPATRGYLWEWLVHQAARREGVLVPRSTFLNVVQNGHALGVYFLEEHFEKELLESQGRREGPIVVWDEGTLWSTLLEEGNVPAKGVEALESAGTEGAHTAAVAEIRAFGLKRLSSIESLSRHLQAALDELRGLRALALTDQPATERARAFQALEELRGRTLERLVDVDRLGCAHALLSLFQSEHGLAWHNQRWYHDPVQARLEPVLFDCAAQDPGGRDPVPWRATDLTAAFSKSPAYQARIFHHLGRFLRSDWLDELFTAVAADLARFEAAIAGSEELPPGHSSGEMKQRLRAQVVWLRKAALPEDGVNFECAYQLVDPAANAGKGWLDVRAWSTTRAPVVLEGFQFSNGSTTAAAGTLAGPVRGALVRGASVMLPVDGTVALFRIPMDERLANLEAVEKVTRAIRAQIRDPEALDLDVRARHRLAAAEEVHEELLSFRRALPEDPWGGRPAAPGLEEALERHPFLRFDPVAYELQVPAGTWDVAGDLVLPSGIPLALGAGTTLRFAPGAVLLADAPLRFTGVPGRPVVLEPQTTAPWAGVVVLGAEGRSLWSDVVVRATTFAIRGGWAQTGAVTFYRSPVTMERVHFDGTEAEDALNVFGTDLALTEVVISGARSDSFDGDFVTGTFERCEFRDGQADGLDVSGADVLVRDCTFLRLGDKGCSIGERSRARIEGGRAEDVAVGVASKDASEVEVTGLAITARHYGLATFVKKPEYGPARLVARDCTITAALGAAIAQTGCVLEVDGVATPTQDIDVEASYEEGVLGRAK